MNLLQKPQIRRWIHDKPGWFRGVSATSRVIQVESQCLDFAREGEVLVRLGLVRGILARPVEEDYNHVTIGWL